MKTLARKVRHQRVRSRISGTAKRPRLVIFRGAKTVSAQLVDDAANRVMLTVTSAGKKSDHKVSAASATQLGAELAKQAKAKQVSTVVFDRAGYAYHGAVKAVADAAREGGMKL